MPSTVLMCRTVSDAFTPPATHGAEQASGRPSPDFTVLRGLTEAGFDRLSGMDDPFPFLHDMDARVTRDQLTISGPGSSDTLVTCPVVEPYNGPLWFQPALTEGRLGVVMLVGADPDPAINPGAELAAAIAEGRAVGASTRIVAETALSVVAHRLTGRRTSPQHQSVAGLSSNEHHFRRAA